MQAESQQSFTGVSISEFEGIYDQFAGAIYSLIRLKITDNDLAGEVLQNTFAYAYRNYARFDGSKSRMFTWLNKIMLQQLKSIECIPEERSIPSLVF